MITFIDEEKENGTGSDWIEIDSQHSDICLISVGKSTLDGEGKPINNSASYGLIGIDILKLHTFTQNSELGDVLNLEWRSDDDTSAQLLSVLDFRDYFMVTVVEEKTKDEEKVSKDFSYNVDRETFTNAVKEMRELYGYIHGEQG